MATDETSGTFGEERTFAPVRERAEILDAIRGVAILGILAVNVEFFRTPEILAGYPGGYEGAPTLAERGYTFLTNFLTYGKFITALAFLFGLGLALQAARVRRSGRNPRGFLARRLSVLAGFGALHAVLVWSGDILLQYALLGFPLLLLIGRRPRTLVSLAVGIFAAFSVVGLILAFLTPPATGGSVPPFWAGLAADAESAYTSGSYPRMVAQRLRELGTYAPLVFISAAQVFPMMLLGTAAANAGWVGDTEGLRARARRAVLWGLGLGLPANLFYALSFEWDLLVGTRLAPAGDVAWYVGAPLMACGWMGLAVLVLPRLRGACRRLAAVGRMALTNYLAQSVLMTSVFYGLALYGRASVPLALALVVVVWAFELSWSRPLLERFSYGPVEWLWRRLSYGRLRPARDVS